ncbi:hypothetical protein KZZ06_20960, partial [Sulfitobacter sp. CW3]|nr:hypothetical protein [Sulfitobacter sp. CW3]
PPEAPDSDAGNEPPAVSVCLQTLVQRADFLKAARAQWKAMPSMVVRFIARSPVFSGGALQESRPTRV